jgi:hypothetical protein
MLSMERKEQQMMDLRNILLGNSRSVLKGRSEGDGSEEEKGGEGDGGVRVGQGQGEGEGEGGKRGGGQGQGEREGEEVEMLIDEWLLKVHTYLWYQNFFCVHGVALHFLFNFSTKFSHQHFLLS